MPYQSWFTYNIVRNYPFRWFTPVVIIGGIVSVVVFSFLNLAASGYNLQTIYTTDPNATLHQDYWFTKAPWSWMAKSRPTCQAQNIPVGSTFFTSNLGFSYTLEAVSRYSETIDASVNYPSLPYMNQQLDECHVQKVNIDVQKRDETENWQSSWWSWRGTGKVTVTCTVSTEAGPFNATFSTLCGRDQTDYSYVIQTNYTHLSSMWWATRLMNLYWNSLLTGLAQAPYQEMVNGSWTSTPIWMTFSMTLAPNKTDDITVYDFFSLSYYIIAANANLFNAVDYPLDAMYNNGGRLAFSIALTEGLSWGKLAYSSVLVDLGKPGHQNLLMDEHLLQYIMLHPDDSFRNDPENSLNCSDSDCNYYWFMWSAISPPGTDPSWPNNYSILMSDSYDTFKAQMSPLGTFDATIFTQYACSIPVRKEAGALFITILIADLVFLQAVWVLLNVVAANMVVKKSPSSMYCEGCNRQYELVPGTSGPADPAFHRDNTNDLWHSSVTSVLKLARKRAPSTQASLLPDEIGERQSRSYYTPLER